MILHLGCSRSQRQHFQSDICLSGIALCQRMGKEFGLAGSPSLSAGGVLLKAVPHCCQSLAPTVSRVLLVELPEILQRKVYLWSPAEGDKVRVFIQLFGR